MQLPPFVLFIAVGVYMVVMLGFTVYWLNSLVKLKQSQPYSGNKPPFFLPEGIILACSIFSGIFLALSVLVFLFLLLLRAVGAGGETFSNCFLIPLLFLGFSGMLWYFKSDRFNKKLQLEKYGLKKRVNILSSQYFEEKNVHQKFVSTPIGDFGEYQHVPYFGYDITFEHAGTTHHLFQFPSRYGAVLQQTLPLVVHGQFPQIFEVDYAEIEKRIPPEVKKEEDTVDEF